MTAPLDLLALALLWPLFPASMLFNALLDRLRFSLLRALVSVAFPMAGVLLLPDNGPAPLLAPHPAHLAPAIVPALALFTAIFYGWRSLTANDLSRWAAMIGTSSLALLWLPWYAGAGRGDLAAAAFAFGSACAVLHVVALALARRVGSDYLGQGRVGAAHPRLAVLICISVLAALCAPPFPGFFAMFFIASQGSWWIAAGVGAVWWLWSWSGALLWQRALFGPPAAGAQGPDVRADTCVLAGVPALLLSAAAFAWSATWMR